MKKIIIALALAAAALSACDVPQDTEPVAAETQPSQGHVSKGYGSKDASADVSLGVAVNDGTGFLAINVPVIVTNHSEKPSDYLITVAAEVGGVRVDTDNLVFVENLAPGATAEVQSNAWTDDRVTESATFTVLEVSRTASN